jgi:tryptophan-rich sensory protein
MNHRQLQTLQSDLLACACACACILIAYVLPVIIIWHHNRLPRQCLVVCFQVFCVLNSTIDIFIFKLRCLTLIVEIAYFDFKIATCNVYILYK